MAYSKLNRSLNTSETFNYAMTNLARSHPWALLIF